MRNILYIISLLLLAVAPSMQGQGQVIFNNRVTSAGLFAPIYGVNPNCLGLRLSGNATTNGGTTDYTGWPLLQGTGFTAALWANQPGVGWVELAQTRFRTTASTPGVIQPLVSGVQVPWVMVDGTPVEFQVRAWSNPGGTVNTWAAAIANGTVGLGASDPFTAAVAVLPPAQNPSILIGLTSFNLTVAAACVPEPSVMVLGALAGVALLWRRRVGRKV